MKFNTGYRKSPYFCHFVCSLHIPRNRFPPEANTDLSEEVCFAALARIKKKTAGPGVSESDLNLPWSLEQVVKLISGCF